MLQVSIAAAAAGGWGAGGGQILMFLFQYLYMADLLVASYTLYNVGIVIPLFWPNQFSSVRTE
jgi:hypothetical protein